MAIDYNNTYQVAGGGMVTAPTASSTPAATPVVAQPAASTATSGGLSQSTLDSISAQIAAITKQAQGISSQIPTATAQPTQQSIYAPAANYTGTSIVDFLNQASQPSDYASRAALATKYGITGYTGTAAQNTQLLGILKSMGAGNTNSVGVPNNISTINNVGTTPSVTTPIDASSLSSGSGLDLNSILGAGGSSATSTIDSQIAGLINQWNTSSQYQ